MILFFFALRCCQARSGDCFVDISNQLEGKIRALQACRAARRDFSHGRAYKAVKARAVYDWVSAGSAAAEALGWRD
ncbi:MAG: hypothetical protein KKC76_18235 [Proteobacteria bacterium]|nr:hypothetical protein [Pseudomonadota bacterium]MBU4296643.1 hypothetical protein [Pseudomonadota bacterium]MCG2748436.1 hypothetical protein [Desulfobulbaceae bacterium]